MVSRNVLSQSLSQSFCSPIQFVRYMKMGWNKHGKWYQIGIRSEYYSDLIQSNNQQCNAQHKIPRASTFQVYVAQVNKSSLQITQPSHCFTNFSPDKRLLTGAFVYSKRDNCKRGYQRPMPSSRSSTSSNRRRRSSNGKNKIRRHCTFRNCNSDSPDPYLPPGISSRNGNVPE